MAVPLGYKTSSAFKEKQTIVRRRLPKGLLIGNGKSREEKEEENFLKRRTWPAIDLSNQEKVETKPSIPKRQSWLVTDESDQAYVKHLSLDAAENETRLLQHYRIPISCLQDINQSHKRITNLLTYCHNLEESTGVLYERQDVSNNLNVIDIYMNPEECDIHSLIERKDVQVQELCTWNIFEERADSKRDVHQFIGIVVGNSGAKVIKSLYGFNMVVLNDDRFDCFQKNKGPNNCISALRNVIDCLMFEPLIQKCESLGHVLDTLNEKSQKKLQEKSQNDSNADIAENRRLHQEIKKQESEDSEWSMDAKLLEPFRKRRDEVEDLYEEMIAAISRSSLKEKHLTRLKGCRQDRHGHGGKQISKKRFERYSIVKGCGYRRKHFQVDVERLSSWEEQSRHEQQIRDFLNKNGITDAKFNIVSSELVKYSFVGAHLAVKSESKSRYGTLGCFANYSKEYHDESSLCALHSRHIIHGYSPELYIKDEEQELKRFGTVISETNVDSGHDIAAARIENKNVSSCDIGFKNQKGKTVPGELYRVEDHVDLQGQPIHLWGANSKPGIGKVTVQYYFKPGDGDTCYIEVQDGSIALGMADAVLAEPGDSGAIICMDESCGERVKVISMLIGEKIEKTEAQNGTEEQKNKKQRKKYTTFPLSSGLQSLEKRTEGKFMLQGTVTSTADSAHT